MPNKSIEVSKKNIYMFHTINQVFIKIDIIKNQI